MRMTTLVLAAALALPAMAHAADRNATTAIAAGDFTAAERILTAERRLFPERAELMLNLAAVYRQTGRTLAAQSLYADVLRRPEVLMDLPDRRIASSHALAQAGLMRTTQVATR